MNYAPRTTPSPSVGPRLLHLACGFAYSPYCSVTLFVRESRPNDFHREHRYPELGMCGFDGVWSHFGRTEFEYLRNGVHVIEGTEVNVIGAIAFTSACGAAALFMLAFLFGLLREASRTRIRFTKRHKSTSLTPVSIEHPSPHSDQAA
jgi:hypothetical protein